MKKEFRGITFCKAAAFLLAVLIGVIGIADFSGELEANASASGPSPSFTNAPLEGNCTACHVGTVNSGGGNISIAGLPANYLPGQQIPLTVTVSQANAVIFGFQLTAVDKLGRNAGSYALPAVSPQSLQVVTGFVNGNQRRYVEHTSDGVVPTQFDTKSWTFTWTAPAQRVGKVSFYAAGNGANSNGATTGDQIYTTSGAALAGSALANFDSDGQSDFSVFRPSMGEWYSLNSTDGNLTARQWGQNGDEITPGDYDGDGKTDFSIWRPTAAVWCVLTTSGEISIVPFGKTGDIPVPGDYDGDLKTDLAVYRPSEGVWYILRSSDSAYDIRQWGLSTDRTAQGDYDADGKTDIAIWRPSNGLWCIWRSSDNGFTFAPFGQQGDAPVQGDYDGDGKADIAVFRPADGAWYLQNSSTGFSGYFWGTNGDRPVPADYDSDGRTDIAVFRNGAWYVLRSSDASFFGIFFGQGTDVPIPSGYIAD